MDVSIVIGDGERDNINHIREACLSDPNIKVDGLALTGRETISLAMKIRPKVIIVSTNLPDIPVPKILERLMRQFPTPVLVLYRQDDEALLHEIKSMDMGIVDFLSTPQRRDRLSINEVSLTTRIQILSKLKIEKFHSQIGHIVKKIDRPPSSSLYQRKNEFTLQRSTLSPVAYTGLSRSAKVIIIGTSTGGPRLLTEIVPVLPINLPPVVVVQHMPVGFITAFASRLDRLSEIKVKEAIDGELIIPGTVYLAPGGHHLEFNRNADRSISIRLTDGPPVNYVKPAVDVTLISSAKIYGSGTVGVILTGMGQDGRKGSMKVKKVGGKIICLNEEDSDVYGMNKAVIESGYVDEIVSKNDLVISIIRTIEGRIL